MKLLRYILDLIASWFTSQNYALGNMTFSAPKPWKLSSLTATKFGLFIGTYDSESRSNSELHLNGQLIYRGNDETIGQGLDSRVVYFAGENGNLLLWEGSKIVKGIRLAFASTCGMFNGKPYVFNSDKHGIHAINCTNNVEEFKLPGGGIVMMSAEDGGKLYTAAGDGGGGIACSDGTLLAVPNCQCIIKYNGRIFANSGNKLIEKVKDGIKVIDELPCEKIMHMDVNSGLLWVAGSCPDVLYTYNQVLRRKEVARFPDDVTPVGGSMFRVRVTDGYFGRCANGNQAEVYKIKEG